MTLTGKQARYLRGLAHHRDPVVIVGDRGVTAEVLQACQAQLEAHELIKVKVAGAHRDDVREAAEAMSSATGAAVAQIIGRIVVLYLARTKKPAIVLPPAAPPEAS